MAFEKGRSGNPGGRPKKSDEQIKFERKCREYADLNGFDRLRKWADKDDPKVSMPALMEILNRGFGKSVETSVIEANVTSEIGSSVEDLAREAADLLGGGKVEGGSVDGKAAVDPGK